MFFSETFTFTGALTIKLGCAYFNNLINFYVVCKCGLPKVMLIDRVLVLVVGFVESYWGG
jgi:hypothetical protein